MLDVKFLSLKPDVPASGYWDQAFLSDLLFSLTESDRTVVVIPGAYQGDIIDKINLYLSQFPKVLVFITSDEEGRFDCEKLWHPDVIHYTQYGNCKHGHHFPIGYTEKTRYLLKEVGLTDKEINIFFAGQLNSSERRNLFSKIALVEGVYLLGTNGFAKGLSTSDYFSTMAKAKAVLSPGGWVSPDSFRFYEALEAGAVPIYSPPFVREMLEDFPDVERKRYTQELANTVFSWWIRKKMLLRQRIKDDLAIREAMTIVIPTSPIPSHPSTEIIDQTIQSIRHHTSMDIIITIDGVRDEQQHMRKDYTEYIRRLLWKCNFEYQNVTPIIFDKHVHQSGMMKEALSYVKTPLVMYVEHDTPLVTDREIDWAFLTKVLFRGDANAIRFHFEGKIPAEHEYLMLPEKDMPFLLATKQWSQRPHIARTDFYKELMNFFSSDANCFIEDLIYGKCVNNDWNDWKLFIYKTPETMKFSLNLDGRAGDRKFEAEQVW